MAKDLLKVLESVKQLGAYAIQMYYGKDVECDDSDVKQEERKIIILGNYILDTRKPLWYNKCVGNL